MAWIYTHSTLLLTSVVMALAYTLAIASRYRPSLVAAYVPAFGSRLIGWAAFAAAGLVTTVVFYWANGVSHSNALSGLLPWADAEEYYGCLQQLLRGTDGLSADCSKRPYYQMFFAGLLWLTGEDLQISLLLQACVVSLPLAILANSVHRTFGLPAALGSFSVLFVFSALFGSGLVMTENAGLLFGVFGFVSLWRCTDGTRIELRWLFVGVTFLAMAHSIRPGAVFVLLGVLVWLLAAYRGSVMDWGRGIVVVAAAVALGSILPNIPALILGADLSQSQSNFSYSLYGLVAGGEGWQYVRTERPDLFEGDPALTSSRIYAAAFESMIERPHLFLLGYVKGLGYYFDSLFKMAHAVKPLQYLGFDLAWLIGFIVTFARRHDRRYSLLLLCQIGVIVSSPFITYDGGDRVYAATIVFDAVFVGLGLSWVAGFKGPLTEPDGAVRHDPGPPHRCSTVRLASVFVLAPIVFAAMLRSTDGMQPLSVPQCAEEAVGVVLDRDRGTLVLPLVSPGEDRIYPLAVRADAFADRMQRFVHAQPELRKPAGTRLVWGVRLEDSEKFTRIVKFTWDGSGSFPESGATAFCVTPPDRSKDHVLGVGTAAPQS